MGKFENKEKVEEVKKPRRPGTWGFAISDCPTWLFRKFDELSKARHNDMYWVTLLETVQKAEAYDSLMMDGISEPLPQEEDGEVKEDKSIPTMGGNTASGKK